jgi:NAD(P)-dependent dehydrogenase (short-subunit alcohol dehydrogenase family)
VSAWCRQTGLRLERPTPRFVGAIRLPLRQRRYDECMSKTWLITGSSRGLGRNLVSAALEAGDRVVATARRASDLRELSERYGDRLRSVDLDVTDASAARGAVAVAMQDFGGLDVVVNNAGYANVNSIEDLPEDDFRRQFETNFFGVYNVTRAALPVLREQRAGHIVQISSVGGRVGTPGLASYQAAKWAGRRLRNSLRRKPHACARPRMHDGWRTAVRRISPVSKTSQNPASRRR